MVTIDHGVFAIAGRIDSQTAPQLEQELFALYTDGPAVLDMEHLEYISSAGLRVLLKLRKVAPSVTLRNVNNEVYDILDMTGFTELLTVERGLRFVSTEGLTRLGRGAHGNVYRLSDDMIVKTYHDGSTPEMIRRERDYGRSAFVKGVPCAIAFEVVRCEEGYGVVFELAGAETLSHHLTQHPEDVMAYGLKYAALLKTLNTTPADTDLFGSMKGLTLSRLREAAPYFTAEENATLERMLNAIPEATTMTHGDYHPGNVMVDAEGELLLIDMADIGYGDPLYDVGGTYLTMVLAGQRNPELVRHTIGVDYAISQQLWDILLPAYYDTQDPRKLGLITHRCAAFALLRMASTLGTHTDTSDQLAPAMVELLRQKLFPNAEQFCALFAMEV